LWQAKEILTNRFSVSSEITIRVLFGYFLEKFEKEQLRGSFWNKASESSEIE
jgi:hypothetical protein